MESSTRDHSHTVYVAHKMGPVQTSNKRRKVRDGPGEVVTRVWVDVEAKRYVPSVGESVIGVVMGRQGESFKVDIGTAQTAQLSQYAFEGATKQMKPRLETGTVVFARVSVATKDMDPEIECVDPKDAKAGGFGQLKGGFVTECSLQLCRRIMTTSLLANIIGTLNVPFETAIGMNGRIWIHGSTPLHTIALKRVLEAVDRRVVDGDDKEELERWMKKEGVVLQ
ncbi:hypothetical protein QFC21_002337 [Naganishia friedmannii]|uniref:Uncharacterized protein n=1 Tax=Naganishia friedmannii TaxID=89922 RepID=A0ACC2VYE2_9TREE|nr:hypothetical protein QFC21_002337 [Naganishia friedmannii]